jgi:thiamine pyrophosphokinase
VRNFQQFLKKVTLIGGGAVTRETFEMCLDHAPELWAADSGATQALDLGQFPLAVSGDMDSVSLKTQDALGATPFIVTPDQDFTDFHKALCLIDASIVLGVGFMGGRLDHELSCYNTLVRLSEKPVILVGDVDLCFHVKAGVAMNLPVGTRFSLFPMARVVVHGAGLRWPVEQMEMAPWGRVGTSNETTEPRVEISVEGEGLLVILARENLAAAIDAVKAM